MTDYKEKTDTKAEPSSTRTEGKPDTPKGTAAAQGISDESSEMKDVSEVKLNQNKISKEQVEEVLGRKSLWYDNKGQPIEPKGTEGRGVDYEKIKNANIGGTFEKIDDYDPNTRTATSLKSIDLNAKSYRENPSLVEGTTKKYVDDLSNFDDTVSTQKGKRVEILKDDIDNYNLSVAIPSGTCVGENKFAFQEADKYAKSKNVNLIIDEVP